MKQTVKSQILAVNGKKAQLVIDNGRAYFGSHSANWGTNPTTLGMKSGWGWKFIVCLGETDQTTINNNDLQMWRGKIENAIGEAVVSIDVREQPTPRPTTTPTTEPAPVATPTTTTTDPLALLRQLLGGGTDPNTSAQISQIFGVLANVTKNLNDTRAQLDETRAQLAAISDRQPIEHKYNITSANGPHTFSTKHVAHKEFKTVLDLVNMNIPVYLYGPAGSGKSELVKQVATALGLPFYYTGSVQQEYKLTGFKDASGTYQETDFFKAVTGGGVFFADEFDGSAPDVALLFNAVLANGICEFAGTTYQVHKDFRFLAAGNTTGLGQTDEYTGRYQLDAATLDRFAVVTIDYDPKLEESFCNGDTDIIVFVRELRKAVTNTRIKSLPLGYRSIIRLAQLTPIFGVTKALEMSIIKGMEKEDVRMMSRGLSRISGNKFADELAKY